MPDGYVTALGRYVPSLEERISRYVIIDGKNPPHPTPLPRNQCWIWVSFAPWSRKHRSINSFGRPVLNVKGKIVAPFRHFFPELPKSIRLRGTTCKSDLCQNPWHRIIPPHAPRQVFIPQLNEWHTELTPVRSPNQTAGDLSPSPSPHSPAKIDWLTQYVQSGCTLVPTSDDERAWLKELNDDVG